MHSELSEALEAYRLSGGTERYIIFRDDRHQKIAEVRTVPPDTPGKPHGVPSELADVVIRVADMAAGLEMDIALHLDRLINVAKLPIEDSIKTFGDWIAAAHSYLGEAFDTHYLQPTALHPVTSMYLSYTINTIQRMAAHYGIDLDAAIAAKMEYNQSRPYRHGGKAL